MSTTMEDLKTEVARQGTVATSAVALLKGLETQLEAAINKTADGEDDQPLHDLLSDLRKNNDALAKAVEEGTQGGGANPQSGASGPATSDATTQTGTTGAAPAQS